ncbi:hypothetical protein ACSAZK_03255 [Methanosarcina sp. Mfa9]|uniref:hypothetical protein n=1 Tax=Methanosarcina sp. Mfa9 TaxID=3439063 RepID=UPI003F84613F
MEHINANLLNKIAKINISLRKAYGSQFVTPVTPDIPFGGNVENSIGPWPEYILHGFNCLRSEKGFCTPCGYSNVPPVLKDKNVIYEYLLKQVDFIFHNVNKTILENQFLKAYPSDLNKVAITLTGSFFSDYEISTEYRRKVVEKIVEGAEVNGIKLQLFIETHAEDVINSYNNGELSIISDSLRKLNTVVLMGFESVNEVSRELLYFKNLNIEAFENAVNIIKKLGLRPGAFIFAGLHSMTQNEIVMDVRQSIEYLKHNNVLPVLMISNFKEFTVDHLLFSYGRHFVVEPRTVLKLMDILYDQYGENALDIPWMIADPVGGPPAPEAHSFKNMRGSCSQCAEVILSNIRMLRETYDWSTYFENVNKLNACYCTESYNLLLENEKYFENNSLIDRVVSNIEFVEKNKDNYIYSMKNVFDA